MPLAPLSFDDEDYIKELEAKVAQLEERVRLLESTPARPPRRAPWCMFCHADPGGSHLGWCPLRGITT